MATNLTPRKQGSITKADMDASRLVFVFVKDAKPKRKVAIPVPDGFVWAEFVHQVKSKLRLAGVKEIFLAASGQKVTSLDELQDIDELCVVEGVEDAQNGIGTPNAALLRTGAASVSGQAGDSARTQPLGHDRFKVVVADGASRPGGDADEGKYTRRAPYLKRLLQRFVPSFFAPGLPVVNRDQTPAPGTDADRGGAEQVTRLQKRRKPRRGLLSWQNLLPALAILLCFGTMLLFLMRAAPNIS